MLGTLGSCLEELLLGCWLLLLPEPPPPELLPLPEEEELLISHLTIGINDCAI
jgi:hypothetical protein